MAASNMRGYLVFGFVMAAVFVFLHFMMMSMRAHTPLSLDSLNTQPRGGRTTEDGSRPDHKDVVDEIRAMRQDLDRKISSIGTPSCNCPETPAAPPPKPQETLTSELDASPGYLASYNVWDARKTHVVRFPVNQEPVRVYRTDYEGSSSNYVTSEFWSIMERGVWEMPTFNVYKQVIIPGRSVVIDFGAWIGPTVLYAATCGAKKVYGLEPDVTAFSELQANVYRNPHLPISITPGCIAHETRTFEFTHEPQNKPGDSMSKLAFNLKAKGSTTWETQCWTLEEFVRRMEINIADVHLLKVDCEGCEELIAPHLTSYLDRLKQKPAIWFSAHQFWWQGNVDEARRRLIAFFQIYKYVYHSPREGDLVLMETYSADSVDWTATFLLSDLTWDELPNRK